MELLAGEGRPGQAAHIGSREDMIVIATRYFNDYFD